MRLRLGTAPCPAAAVKRTGPPARRTELSPGTAKLTRSTPMRRTAMAAGAGTSKPRPKAKPADDIPAPVRAGVLVRAAGMCECGCGRPLPPTGAHLHHRLRRSQGGEHTQDNLVALRPLCHVLDSRSVHERPRRETRRLGLMLRRGDRPADEPLTLATGARVYLHPTESRYLTSQEHRRRSAA